MGEEFFDKLFGIDSRVLLVYYSLTKKNRVRNKLVLLKITDSIVKKCLMLYYLGKPVFVVNTVVL